MILIILCIWCNRICWHALMFKKHIIFLYIMPRLSQTLSFLQSPSFWQAQSALIGQLAQCIVIGRTPPALVGNVTPLSIIASFSSLVLPSVQAREGNRVTWETVMMLVCVCKQAAIKTADSTVTLSLSFSLSPSLTRTHAHTHTHTHLN